MSILSGELRTISGLDCLASSLFSIGKTYSIVPQKKNVPFVCVTSMWYKMLDYLHIFCYYKLYKCRYAFPVFIHESFMQSVFNML